MRHLRELKTCDSKGQVVEALGPHENLEVLTDVLHKAALAGAEAIERTRADMMLRHKGFKEVVTNCDIASENAVTEVLQQSYPQSCIYSEEVGVISGREELLFIIDPIDGTHNFIHGIPFYAVSIGLYRLGEPYAGLIYQPAFDKCFAAVKGHGVFVNGRQMQTSDVAALGNAMVTYDNQFHKHPAMLKNLGTLAKKCFTVRILGSACCDMCSVAAGEVEARIFHDTKLVDYAAGITIVREAGGDVVTFDGHDVKLDTTDVIVTNGKITRELVELIRN